MSDWPELERRLVDSARKRSGRRWAAWGRRVLIPVAVACAALASIALLGSRGASDERSVTAPGVGGTRSDPADPTGPGVHGTRLDSVAYGDETLRPGTVNRLPYRAGRAFIVAVTNQGVNDEADVEVSVRIAPVDGEPVTTGTRTLPAIAAGKRALVPVGLVREPPVDRAAALTVTVAKVPGERTRDPRDDNELSFPVLFSAPAATPEATATPTRSAAPATPIAVSELVDTPAVRDDLASGGELARAWKVPALKGHVHLIRKPDGWCLSAPDPLAGQPEIERGKTCTDPTTFAARGISIGIGAVWVSVGPAADAPLNVTPGTPDAAPTPEGPR